MVDALNGEPGIYSARYAPGGHDATDREKYMYLLSKLEGVEDRRAKFVTSICCIFPNGDIIRTATAASATTRCSCPTASSAAWPCLARR